MTDSRYKKYKDCNLEELEQIVEDLENMSHNKVNIKRLQADMDKALTDIESLKDKVRQNGH